MTNPITEIHSDLIKIGLTEKEAMLYTAALGTSTFSLAEIAKLSGLKRPTCYLIIETLLKKSLIARVPDSRSARYIIVEPHIVLEREKEKLKDTEKMVKLMMQIRSREERQDAPHIELYHGVEGVKQICSMILHDKPNELKGIINIDFLMNYLGENFMREWVSSRKKNNIMMYSLQRKTDDPQKHFKASKEELREVRILPDKFEHNSFLYLWGNKVGFISDKKEGISFIVDSKEYAKLNNSIFNTIFSMSREQE